MLLKAKKKKKLKLASKGFFVFLQWCFHYYQIRQGDIWYLTKYKKKY
jgi:hypothetical protein